MAFELAALFTSARAAYDIAKGINSLHAQKEIDEAVSKVLQILLSVQSDALTMQKECQSLTDQKDRLVKKVEEYEQWTVKESQYDLVKLRSGVLVREPNDSHPDSEPLHWLCANCFDRKIKSFLQKESVGLNSLVCQSCKTTFYITEEDKNEYLSQ